MKLKQPRPFIEIVEYYLDQKLFDLFMDHLRGQFDLDFETFTNELFEIFDQFADEDRDDDDVINDAVVHHVVDTVDADDNGAVDLDDDVEIIEEEFGIWYYEPEELNTKLELIKIEKGLLPFYKKKVKYEFSNKVPNIEYAFSKETILNMIYFELYSLPHKGK